jgi:RND family efflux transporter MFP subunit
MRTEKKLLAFGILVSLGAAGGVLVMTSRQRSALAGELDARRALVARGPAVRVAKVGVTPANRTVVLTAEVRANQRATLYAKVSGYLREIHVDKGDSVRKGQLLAVLESPEADEGVVSAQADLALRQQVVDRARSLRKTGFVSQGELDQAEANLKVAQSALERTRATKRYEELRAPFDGVVTARFADPGALLPAATGATQSAQPLVELADVDRLRIAVQLGQDDAALVRPGDPVILELASGSFPAKVSRLARALDLKTRTMLAEVDLVKPPPGVLPGAFVQVALTLHGPPRPLVPGEALLSQQGKLMVPLVVDGKLHLVVVRTGIDDGKSVEVVSGLNGGEIVALNLGNDAVEGAPVQPANAL